MNWVRIVSDNGLSPIQRQAIVETNGGFLSIGALGTNFGEIFIKNTKLFIHGNASENIACQNGGHFVQGKMSLKSIINNVIQFDVLEVYSRYEYKQFEREQYQGNLDMPDKI